VSAQDKTRELDETLDESMLPADPMDLFGRWLATVSADGRPRARWCC
jgi:hypothetical protein